MEFKYHGNPLKTKSFFNDKIVKCDCCNKDTGIYYKGPFYSKDDIEYLCPKCIKNGEACKKFDGCFIDISSVDKIFEKEKVDELIHRTPSYFGFQQEAWLSHCDDYSEFVGVIKWEDIEAMKIEDEIKQNYNEKMCHISFEQMKKSLKKGIIRAYLFKCLTCKTHAVYVDYD